MQTRIAATTKKRKDAMQGLQIRLRRGLKRMLAAKRLSQQKIHFLAFVLEYKVARKGMRQATMKVGIKMRKRRKRLGPPSSVASMTTGSIFSIKTNIYIISTNGQATNIQQNFCYFFISFDSQIWCINTNQQYLYIMKESLLRKSVINEQELSLQTQQESQDHKTTMHSQTARKRKKTPSKKIIQIIRDESFELEMQNFGVLRNIIRLYQRFPILNPESTAILFWNILNFIIIIFYLIEIGLLVGFGQAFWEDEINYFYAGNIVFIVLFLIDILISPLKAFYQHGILVISRVAIFKRYSRVYLWFDLVALISVAAPYFSLSLSFNYFKLLFIVKLIPAYDLDKYLLMYVKNRFKRSHIYGLFRLIMLIILWSHWFGVGFFALDYWVYSSNYYGPNTPSYCWIYNSPLNFNITQTHWTIQYLYSLYFSIGNITTIAYGDIVPRNPVEALYATFAMTFAILLFTYFFKSMIQLIFESTEQEIENKQNISFIQRFLKNNNVSNALATKVRSYFETSWLQGKLKNTEIETQLIGKLPKQLKLQLNIAFYGDFIIQLGIMPQNIDLKLLSNHSPFVCELSQIIQTQKILAGQLLYSQGEPFLQQECVFFCDNGLGKLSVTLGVGQIDWPHAQQFLQQHKKDEDLYELYGKSLALVNIGGLFGEQSFFTRNNRSHWAVSNKHMQILKLFRSKFDEVLNNYGSKTEKERFCLAKQSIQIRFCYICGERGHQFPKCSYLTYIPGEQSLFQQMRLQNSRTNNKLISRNRQDWLSFTSKQNSRKLFKVLKQQQKDYLRKLQVSQSNDQPLQRQDYIIDEHILEQLTVLRALVVQHTSKQDKSAEKYKEGFDVDEVHLFSVYKPSFNVTEQMKKCNIYIRKKSKRAL